jgi:hypothetical protein
VTRLARRTAARWSRREIFMVLLWKMRWKVGGARHGQPLESERQTAPITPGRRGGWQGSRETGLQGMPEFRWPELKERLDRSLGIDTMSHNIFIWDAINVHIIFNWINKIIYLN